MKERLLGLQRKMPEDIDAVLITSSVNRRYYTGFLSSAGVALVARRKCYFIVDMRYFEAAQREIKGCEVIVQDKLEDQLYKLLKQHKVKRLGIESRTLTVDRMREYRKAFSGIEITEDDRVSILMNEQRAVKSEGELACMRAAHKIADASFLHILEYVEAGRTEREVAAELEMFSLREGSDKPAYDPIIASGPNSAVPHAKPGDRKIQTGDFVTIDFGCTIGGYRSDMTRTLAVGSVSPRQRECYETVLAAQLAAVEAIKAGVRCVDVDKAAREIIDASEFKGLFTHGLGHCVGLEIHEYPRCNKISEDILASGMVTSVEPGIYIPGQFGVRIEDCVAVTEKGCENLCASPKELIIL